MSKCFSSDWPLITFAEHTDVWGVCWALVSRGRRVCFVPFRLVSDSSWRTLHTVPKWFKSTFCFVFAEIWPQDKYSCLLVADALRHFFFLLGKRANRHESGGMAQNQFHWNIISPGGLFRLNSCVERDGSRMIEARVHVDTYYWLIKMYDDCWPFWNLNHVWPRDNNGGTLRSVNTILYLHKG